MTYTIYALFDEREPDAVRYIGFSCNPESRFRSHVYTARHGKELSYRANWLRKVLDDGARPMWRALAVVDSAEIAAQVEIAAIADHFERGHRLTNGTDGGEGAPGYGGHLTPEALARRTETFRSDERRALQSKLSSLYWSSGESREQQRKAMKEFWDSPESNILREANRETSRKQMTGVKRSAESREKMRVAKLGKAGTPRTAEWKAKIAAAQKGKKRRPWTDEERARHMASMNNEKMSASARARWAREKGSNVSDEKENPSS